MSEHDVAKFLNIRPDIVRSVRAKTPKLWKYWRRTAYQFKKAGHENTRG